MLLFFTVENFKSISEKQSFSMFPIETEKNGEPYICTTGNQHFPYANCAAAIFGANASGKSAFVTALDKFQDLVIDAGETKPNEGLDVTPFLLDKSWKEKPTEFEIAFVIDDIYYEYGLKLNRKIVFQEWLFIRENQSNVRSKKLFHRVYFEDENKYKWRFSPSLKSKDKKFLEDRVTSNQLALSKAASNNISDLEKPFKWIASNLKVVNAGAMLAPIMTANHYKKGKSNLVLEFMQHADLDIIEFNIKEKPFEVPDFVKNLNIDERDEFIERFKDVLSLEVSTIHNDTDGDQIEFDLDIESSGTQQLFGFAGPFIDALEEGFTIVIDELNNHLHPLALEYVVSRFNNASNQNGAQLVFTSHDTTIMNSNKLSKDQLWFINKSPVSKNSTIYSLSDFSTRSAKNFQNPYLEGRFGAIPNIKF